MDIIKKSIKSASITLQAEKYRRNLKHVTNHGGRIAN